MTLAIGIIPGTIINVFAGWLLGDLALLDDTQPRDRSPWEWGLYGAGFILVLLISYYVYVKTKQLIKEHSPEVEVEI